MSEEIKKYDFREGLSVEFEIVSMKHLYTTKRNILINPHRAGFYHILWFFKGQTTHLVDFNPIEIKPNTILFLNKNTVHHFSTEGNFDGYVILFTDNFFCKTIQDTKFLHSTILYNDLLSVSRIQLKEQVQIFREVFQLMSEEFESDNDMFQADILRNLLHSFLLFSERERRKQDFTEIKKDSNFEIVMRFRDLLEAEFRNQKQANSFAQDLAITLNLLNQATIKAMGKTPKEMIDDRVMLEAKRLLVYTNRSVKNIGFELGFDEPTNFIKYFRRNSGLTPMEFRNKFLSF